jgi:tRNA nucleotidyltransferase (CCA-adding enzyme)
MSIEKIENIIDIVLSRVKPDNQEKQRLYQVFEFVKTCLEKCLSEILSPSTFEVTLQGSVAKDTFLKGQSDIDVFILFPPNKDINIDWFERTLIPIIIKCFNKYKNVLNYASHPYVTIYIDSVEVNIVPAYKVPSPDKIISAVDRTPFHTMYIKTHLSESQKDEVRLLKQFLKNWNLYGAEIEVQGFSGYLVELLIIAYENFYNLLKNASQWHAYKTCIDIEHHYSSIEECLNKFKGSALIVVDPVDPRRNVAAAVSLKKFSMFKLLAKMFLEFPSIEFFFNNTNIEEDLDRVLTYVENRLRSYDSCLYLLVFKVLKPVPDMIWGQLYRLKNSLLNTLKVSTDNKYIYLDVWIDRNSLKKAAIAIEYMQCSRRYKLHIGPYAYDVANAIKFLMKNLSSEIGPWIDDDGRLYSFKLLDRDDIVKTIINTVKSTSFSGISFEDLIVITSASDLHKLTKLMPGESKEFVYWLKQFLERKYFRKIYSTIYSVLDEQRKDS